MATLTLVNKQGSIGAVIFPKVYESLGAEELEDDAIYGFTGVFSKRQEQDSYQFVVREVTTPDKLKSEAINRVYIEFDEEELGREDAESKLYELKEFIDARKGNLQVFSFIESDPDVYVRFNVNYFLEYSKSLKRDLEAYPVVKNVYFA